MKVLLATLVLFIHCNPAYALWPFDTPKWQAKNICNNAASQSEHASKSRGGMSYKEWVAEFSSESYFRQGKGKILRREILRGIKTAYKNPRVKPETIYDMVLEDCTARIRFIIRNLEQIKH